MKIAQLLRPHHEVTHPEELMHALQKEMDQMRRLNILEAEARLGTMDRRTGPAARFEGLERRSHDRRGGQ